MKFVNKFVTVTFSLLLKATKIFIHLKFRNKIYQPKTISPTKKIADNKAKKN